MCTCMGTVFADIWGYCAFLCANRFTVKHCSNHWTVWSHRFLSEKLVLYRHLNVIRCYMGRRQPELMHRASPTSNIKTVPTPHFSASPLLSVNNYPLTPFSASMLTHWDVLLCGAFEVCAHSTLVWPSAPTHLIWCSWRSFHPPCMKLMW